MSERKTASRFRKDLQESGYLMIQFSIYARPCVSYEQMDTHIARVKSITPEAGNVRMMFITDQQWGNSVTVIGPNYSQGSRAVELRGRVGGDGDLSTKRIGLRH